MEFSNMPIHSTQLPRAEKVSFEPLEPAYKKVLWARSLTATSIALIVLTVIFFISSPEKRENNQTVFLFIGVGIAVVGAFLLLTSLRAFRRKGYAIREKDILFKSGWLVEKTILCPYNRIQHCTQSVGLWDRIWGLHSLRIYTAGSDDGDLFIPGLLPDKAAAIKAFITQGNIPVDQNPEL